MLPRPRRAARAAPCAPAGAQHLAQHVVGRLAALRECLLQLAHLGRGGVALVRQLVAVGSVMNADADRVVIKRIILTGYPVRVHKRTATVKYMFYNPEDVKWFKRRASLPSTGCRATSWRV